MLDIVISGGLAVLPTGPQQADIGVQGEQDRRDRRAGQPRRARRRPHGRCHRADRHPRRHRPACPLPLADADAGPDPAQPDRRAATGSARRRFSAAPRRSSISPWSTATTTCSRRSSGGSRNGPATAIATTAFTSWCRASSTRRSPASCPRRSPAGHATVKMFTTDITPSRKGRMVQFGDIWEVLKALAKAGGLAAIHAEDNDLVMHMYEKLTREGRTSFHNMAEVHTTLQRGFGVQPGDPAGRQHRRLLALYAAHLGGDRRQGDRGGAGPGRADLRRDPAPVSDVQFRGLQEAERPDLPHLSVLEIRRGPGGAVGRHRLRRDPDRRDRRNLLPAEYKLQGSRIDDTTGGNAGVEPRVSLIYTETVEKRGRSLETLSA